MTNTTQGTVQLHGNRIAMLLFIDNHYAVLEIDVIHKVMVVSDGLGYDGFLSKWARHSTHILKIWSILPMIVAGKKFIVLDVKDTGGIIACSAAGILVNGKGKKEWLILAEGYLLKEDQQDITNLPPELFIV